ATFEVDLLTSIPKTVFTYISLFFVSALALTKRPSFEILRLWGHAKAQNSAASVPANHRAFADDGILN
ncbi:hypothetical protein, partial [Companilactobacillus farciminis]|uniref:hypothetical protein n=1 Tax=Companilactobacillus farciminis TaxID=1612 RepID=UPI001F2896FA